MHRGAILSFLRHSHLTGCQQVRCNRRTMSDHGKGTRVEHLMLTALQSRDPDILSAQIVEIQQLSPTVKSFTLKVQQKDDEERNASSSSYRPGQWLDLFIPSVDMVGGFSMYGPPSRLEKDQILDLAVKYSEWPPANWLHTSASVGAQVAVRIGGDFYYEQPDDDHQVLLLAGGVGINPLSSILFHIAEKMSLNQSNCQRLHLVYSAKTEKELLFKDAIEGCAQQQPDMISCSFLATREQKNSRITQDFLKDTFIQHNLIPTAKLVCYLCGPPQMIKDFNNYLLSLGVPKEKIKYELWW